MRGRRWPEASGRHHRLVALTTEAPRGAGSGPHSGRCLAPAHSARTVAEWPWQRRELRHSGLTGTQWAWGPPEPCHPASWSVVSPTRSLRRQTSTEPPPLGSWAERALLGAPPPVPWGAQGEQCLQAPSSPHRGSLSSIPSPCFSALLTPLASSLLRGASVPPGCGRGSQDHTPLGLASVSLGPRWRRHCPAPSPPSARWLPPQQEPLGVPVIQPLTSPKPLRAQSCAACLLANSEPAVQAGLGALKAGLPAPPHPHRSRGEEAGAGGEEEGP